MLCRDGYIDRRQEGVDHAWENRAFYIWVEYRVEIDDEGLAKKVVKSVNVIKGPEFQAQDLV